MKTLLAALLFALPAFPASAEYIDSSLQAVIMSPKYPPALRRAELEHRKRAPGLRMVFGSTSITKQAGPEYTFFIPVEAVTVPMGPERVEVGIIEADLEQEPNSPVPNVKEIRFTPAR